MASPDYDTEAGRAIGNANLRPRVKKEITETQIRVLCVMRKGSSSSSQVAAAMGISPSAARRHVIEIMKRLEIDRDTLGIVLAYKAAVKEAEQRGYLDIPLEPVREPTLTELTKRILLASQTDDSLAVIGEKLGISARSVAAGLSRCYALLGIESSGHTGSISRERRAQALKLALERGILL
jgi:DNA-binding NarL/FixJ family response regulator